MLGRSHASTAELMLRSRLLAVGCCTTIRALYFGTVKECLHVCSLFDTQSLEERDEIQ